ncbi:hypothetical protein BGX28_009668 [Mortierella sp. GBA30]|nr:hypothetical protein BGX28_009668 [Mortierella sp. GBA30]
MPGVVAYTFDDGPGMYNDKLLGILKAKNVTTTFFVLGQMIAQNEQQAGALKKILEHGHQLASHTYTHSNLDLMTEDEMKKEMSSTSNIMFQHSGVRPRYMRAPEGRCAEKCTKVMTDLGLVISHWNVDTNDWRHKGESDPNVAAEKSMVEINEVLVRDSDPKTDSFILLQHEIHKFSVDVLADRVIDAVLKKGYRFVTMEECIGEPPYLDGSVLPSVSGALPSATPTTASGGVPGSSSTGTNPSATITSATNSNSGVLPQVTGNNPNSGAGMTMVAAWTIAMSAVLAYAMV